MTELTWPSVDKLSGSTPAGNGWEYSFTSVTTLGRSGFGGISYNVYFMPVGTPEQKMKDYKIGAAKALEEAKVLAEKHFAEHVKAKAAKAAVT